MHRTGYRSVTTTLPVADPGSWLAAALELLVELGDLVRAAGPAVRGGLPGGHRLNDVVHGDDGARPEPSAVHDWLNPWDACRPR
jgi:hypothetical protein